MGNSELSHMIQVVSVAALVLLNVYTVIIMFILLNATIISSFMLFYMMQVWSYYE